MDAQITRAFATGQRYVIPSPELFAWEPLRWTAGDGSVVFDACLTNSGQDWQGGQMVSDQLRKAYFQIFTFRTSEGWKVEDWSSVDDSSPENGTKVEEQCT